MTNIVAFPDRSASLDLESEIYAIKHEISRLNEMARWLDPYVDRADSATRLAGEMEAVIGRMATAIEALKSKAKPFLKTPEQLAAMDDELESMFR